MAPVWSSASLGSLSQSNSVSDLLSAQWRNPNDIFSVLLLVGPAIIEKAIAQLAGLGITPVAFSFGWVAYAANAVLSAISHGKLMPDADVTDLLVINARTGHVRTTKTWLLGRLYRDVEIQMDKDMVKEQPHASSEKHALPEISIGERPWEALRISIFELDLEHSLRQGVPTWDWLWLSGISVIFLQLCISIVPWILHGAWDIFLITACGNILAVFGGSLPQWTREKWSCPKNGSETVIITMGNGSRHAMVILGQRGVGLDFEILARGTRIATPTWTTRVATGVLAVLWVGLLLTASGLKWNAWYLLGIGVLGSIQNIVAAGATRSSGALGVHIKVKEVLRGAKVADVLKEAEVKYPLLGTALAPVFFPGSMRVDESELQFWKDAQELRTKPNSHGIRIDSIMLPQTDQSKH